MARNSISAISHDINANLSLKNSIFFKKIKSLCFLLGYSSSLASDIQTGKNAVWAICFFKKYFWVWTPDLVFPHLNSVAIISAPSWLRLEWEHEPKKQCWSVQALLNNTWFYWLNLFFWINNFLSRYRNVVKVKYLPKYLITFG